MITLEIIRARVCLAKLESAVYDRICNQVIQDELVHHLPKMGAAERADAVQVISDLGLYCKQISGLIEMLETTLSKSVVGRQMLEDFYQRV